MNAGHCTISSAVQIACPGHAESDDGFMAITDTQSSMTSDAPSTPGWAVALLVMGGLVVLLLLIAVVMLFVRTKSVERA